MSRLTRPVLVLGAGLLTAVVIVAVVGTSGKPAGGPAVPPAPGPQPRQVGGGGLTITRVYWNNAVFYIEGRAKAPGSKTAQTTAVYPDPRDPKKELTAVLPVEVGGCKITGFASAPMTSLLEGWAGPDGSFVLTGFHPSGAFTVTVRADYRDGSSDVATAFVPPRP